MAAAIGLILLKFYKPKAEKYFIYFLIYVIFIEVIGYYPTLFYEIESLNFLREFLRGTYFSRNYWWYTIFWKFGAVIFYAFYFNKILEIAMHRKILKYSTFLFLIIGVSSIVISWPSVFKSSLALVNIIGGLIILECAFLFFIEMLNNEKILNFHKSLSFYISLAILIFWLIKTPLVFYEVYFQYNDSNYIEIRSLINIFVNVFMYSTFAIGLIVSKPKLSSK